MALLALLIAVALASILQGFVLTNLWYWFAVSTFGLPALTIAQAIGLSMLVSFLTYQEHETEEVESIWYAILKAVVKTFLRAAATLVFGWIVYQFI